MCQRSTSAPVVDALAQADALMINTPRRGFLLPLVPWLRPDARIIVSDSESALAGWDSLVQTLPAELVFVEVYVERQGAALELYRRLEKHYGAGETLRSEQVRTITRFRRGDRTAAS